jgi:Spy/CpxP family protein refolding chaperone
MNTHDDSNSKPVKRASRWRRPILIGALATGLGGAFLLGACGHHGPGHGWGGGHGRHHAQDPQAMAERVDFAADWALNKVNATDAQRQQVKSVVKSTLSDLLPMRDQHQAARRAMMDLLAQPAIDRQKLEELRRAELQRAEAASQRLLQGIADAAEVLTPQQRTELAKLMQRHRG